MNLTSAFQNAVASSSKVPVNKKSRISAVPSGPRSLVALSARAREKSPVVSTSLAGRMGPQIAPDTLPPPDPKALAYIPAGPSSNPLNIRPSNNHLAHGNMVPKAPTGLAQPNPKKRVIVGAGWPLVKASPLEPVSRPPPLPPSGLNLSYSSPSPPATTPVVSHTKKKWKRVAGDSSSGAVAATTNMSQSVEEEDVKIPLPQTPRPSSETVTKSMASK